MSELIEKIQADLVVSLRKKDAQKLSVLRMIKSEVQKLQADRGRDQKLSDDDVITVLQRLVKQRQEAAEQYSSGGARERADAELQEAAIIGQYLPRQLSDQELDQIIREVAESVKPSGSRDTGKMMGQVMPRVKGKAPGDRVRDRVADYLGTLE